MGINPKNLNDQQINLIKDPAQRRAVVKARGFDTQEKINAKAEAKLESELHDQYIGFLRRHRLPFIHAAMVKKSTIQEGAPDFCVTGGKQYGHKSLYGEFKLPGNKLSAKQAQYHLYLTDCGCQVFIWYDYQTAMRETAAFFKIDLASNMMQSAGEHNETSAGTPSR